MSRATRVPITAIAVFGVGALIASAVGIAIWLGVGSARRSTEALLVERARSLVASMEATVEARFRPIVQQSEWVARQVASGALDLGDLAGLDIFMAGTFAATPEVAGIAVVDPSGRSRRWPRRTLEVIDEDWSGREVIRSWLAAGREREHGTWEQPFWTPTLDDTVLMHDQPLRRDGRFLGMLAQVVPVAGLSRILISDHAESGVVPFVLYGRDRVLAHPFISYLRGTRQEDSSALPGLESLGDPVLARIWTPDEDNLRLLQGLVDMHTSLIRHEGQEFAFVFKSIDRYGPRPWILGAYLDTREHGLEEIRSVVMAGAGGLTVMIVAVALAMVIGLRVSRRLESLAAAARAVEEGRLDTAIAPGGSRIREIDDAMRAYGQMVEGLRERHLIRSTLGRFVPEPVARTLLDAGGQLEPRETSATVLFCDIEGFTALTESRGAHGIVALLNAFFSEMVHILERYGGVATQFQGDAILATFNVPVEAEEHAGNALRASLEMCERVEDRTFAGEQIRIRIGVNTGTVVAGAVGADRRLSYTVHGDAVNLAARLESMNKQFGTRILASEDTIALVVGFDTHRIGETTIRGQTLPVSVYEVRGLEVRC